MDEYKIVFAGSMGSGKTTAISLLSDITVASTDVINTDITSTKETTTVGIDYGYIDLNDQLRLMLYGTPGQDRFSFMWKIIANNALGVIILINSNSPNALTDMEYYISFFSKEGIQNIVVGITHLDIETSLSLSSFIDAHKNITPPVPIFACDARNKSDILFLLEILISVIEASFHEK